MGPRSNLDPTAYSSLRIISASLNAAVRVRAAMVDACAQRMISASLSIAVVVIARLILDFKRL
jgi:hypothetical protein